MTICGVGRFDLGDGLKSSLKNSLLRWDSRHTRYEPFIREYAFLVFTLTDSTRVERGMPLFKIISNSRSSSLRSVHTLSAYNSNCSARLSLDWAAISAFQILKLLGSSLNARKPRSGVEPTSKLSSLASASFSCLITRRTR